jgi:creatinine amidohydrolase
MVTRTIELERMTWPEVGDALENGFTTVVLPCGAVEQHGPHLPLFMDAEHGTFLGAAVARLLGDALLAPTIRVGCSEHHMDFPGTLSLERSTFVAVCRDCCRSLARHGFERVCVLPTHGGNFAPLEDAVGELDEAAGPDCRVTAFTGFMELMESWKSSVTAAGGPSENVGGHADVAESSLMLHMHPDLVRRDLATAGYRPDGSKDEFRRLISGGFRDVTPNGILGDARGMSRAIGERCLHDLANVVAAHFRKS